MKTYLSYEEAQQLCENHNIKSNTEYRKRYKEISSNLPSDPSTKYDKWNGWSEFLNNKKTYPSYLEAKAMCNELEIQNSSEYALIAKKKGLPISPNSFYKKQWNGWGAFLNNNKRFVSFKEAIKIVKKAKDIRGVKTYQKHYKNYKGLPSMPQDIYAEEWSDWYVFLSKKKPSDVFFDYDQAKALINKHKITKVKDYKAKYKKLSNRLPSDPSRAYQDLGWVSWKDFLF